VVTRVNAVTDCTPTIRGEFRLPQDHVWLVRRSDRGRKSEEERKGFGSDTCARGVCRDRLEELPDFRSTFVHLPVLRTASAEAVRSPQSVVLIETVTVMLGPESRK